MRQLFLDFETASELDLKIVGLDRYLKHKSTRVLMLAWAFDDDPVELWFPHDLMPEKLRAGLADPAVRKISWNAPFEIGGFREVLKKPIPLEEWDCAMAWARHLSLPSKLEKAGPALGIPFDSLKSQEGKRLIRKFCAPFHKGGEETLFGISEPRYHDQDDSREDWKLFSEYCKQDVVAEREIFKTVSNIPLPEKEQKLWILDQQINERGIPVNRKFITNALALSLKSKDSLKKQLIELTGLKNPNSRDQFLPWAEAEKYPFASLGKNFVAAALVENSGITPKLRTVLKLMQESKKTSHTKYEKILAMVSDDDRLRHQFAFLGAARSGRWSGKDAQVQNPARPSKKVEENYDRALQLIQDAPENITDEYLKIIEAEFGSVIGMTISCIRSSFQAGPGKKLVVCDLGSIENRMLGWLADCDAILKVFRDNRDAYLDFASKMYNVMYESIIKIVNGAHKPKDKEAAAMRQVAKPPVLGLGYGLGAGVKKNPDGSYEIIYKEDEYGNTVMSGLMGYAANMGVKLTAEQAYLAWETFRKAYPEVLDLWAGFERAAKKCLATGKTVAFGKCRFVRKTRKDGTFILRIVLPSGRGLHYINARIETELAKRKSDGEEYEKYKIMYDGIGHGVGQISKGGIWGAVYTYGGKITENADQGASRDVLADAMMRVDEMGANIVMHLHDEIICEEEDDPFAFNIHDLKSAMEVTPEWAPGLILGAEGFEGRVYKK